MVTTSTSDAFWRSSDGGMRSYVRERSSDEGMTSYVRERSSDVSSWRRSDEGKRSDGSEKVSVNVPNSQGHKDYKVSRRVLSFWLLGPSIYCVIITTPCNDC